MTSYFAHLKVRATGHTFFVTADSMTGLRLQVIALSAYCDVLEEGLRA